jgi:lipopolysaccharide biosynthesis protein
MKRLFIFAAYDPAANIIDDSLIIYVRELSRYGDVVFFMDNDAPGTELDKLKPYTLYAGAARHRSYDFGSYKRGYIWARDNGILKNYDWVYMVNDSVYAPLHPILPLLTDLESRGRDATGMVYNPHKRRPHIQSWFIGMGRRVFLSEQFDSFITSVERQPDKGAVTYLYEQGFYRMLCQLGGSFACIFTLRGLAVYNKIKRLFMRGLPFMKKSAFIRRHGALGRQVSYVLDNIDPVLRAAIIENANREYGQDYVAWFLTGNIFKILWRNIRHSLYKLFVEGI